jgi:hypothetical protein
MRIRSCIEIPYSISFSVVSLVKDRGTAEVTFICGRMNRYGVSAGALEAPTLGGGGFFVKCSQTSGLSHM